MHRLIFFGLTVGLSVILLSCTEPRIKRYTRTLEPLVGTAKRAEVDSKLGAPVECKRLNALNRCEYRTAVERNDPVPGVLTKNPAFGPDLSAYEYFDVLHLFYDDFWVLREWEPIVIHGHKNKVERKKATLPQ